VLPPLGMSQFVLTVASRTWIASRSASSRWAKRSEFLVAKGFGAARLQRTAYGSAWWSPARTVS
jgi:hypothetical protein